MHRIDVLLDSKKQLKDLRVALKRRKAQDAQNGRPSPESVSAWVREKVNETIAAFR